MSFSRVGILCMIVGRITTLPSIRLRRSPRGLCIPLLALILATACTPAPNAGGAFPTISFDVDSLVLAAPETLQHALVIRRPLSWIPLDSQSLHGAMEAAMQDTTSEARVELLRVFRSETGAALMLSRAPSGLTLEKVQEEEFRRSLERSLGADGIAWGAFKLGTTNAVQFRMIREDIVAFRLFVPAQERLYQVDYLVPAAAYAASLREVESSIGSLTSVEP